MAFVAGVCFRQRTIIFIIISLLIVFGGGLFFKFGFLSGAATVGEPNDSLIPFPDTQLKIKQSQSRLYIDIHYLVYGLSPLRSPVRSSVREDQGLLARLISESGLKWQAVRVAGIKCNGHIFQQHASYGQLHSGLFPSSYQRRMANNFIDLKPEDHGHFYCFQIKENDRYIYHRSPEAVYMRPPAVSHIQQINNGISFYVDASYGLGHNVSDDDPEYHMSAQIARVSDQELRDYRREGVPADESHGCNQELLDNLDINYTLYWSPLLPRALGLMHVPLSEDDIGSRICIGVVNEDLPHMATYKLSHKITGLSNGYTPASPEVTGALTQFDSEIMIDMLATHLTSEGRKLLAGVPDIALIPSEESPKWSAGVTRYDEENKIVGIAVTFPQLAPNYDNLDLFWSEDMQRLFHVSGAVKVLAHEFMHVVHLETGFEEPFSECHTLASASAKAELSKMNKEVMGISGYTGYPVPSISYELTHALENKDYDWNYVPLNNDTGIRIYQAFWSRYDECLVAADNYGQIYIQLKKHALNFNQELYHQDITLYPTFNALGAAERWRYPIGGLKWYAEIHAEVPFATFKLPPELENHYSQFFIDRQNFVQTLFTNNGML